MASPCDGSPTDVDTVSRDHGLDGRRQQGEQAKKWVSDHEMTVMAKAVVAGFYGRAAQALLLRLLLK